MEEEATMELIDYLMVIWKWKWLIIIFTSVCCVVAVIISLKMPEIYEVSIVIEPGIIDIDPRGHPLFIDSISNIKSKIDTKAYNRRISRRLEIDPTKFDFGFKTIRKRDSNTIKIILEMEEKNANKGGRALLSLFHELIKEYQPYIDSRKSKLDQQMEKIKRQLALSINEVLYLEKEVSIAKGNTDMIIDERNALIDKGSQVDTIDKLTLLIYSNIIQQNIAHYNDLKNQLAKLKIEIESMKSEEELLKIKMKSIENIKLIQEPQSSIYPIKPNKKLNVIVAFFIGLFISIFLAFFLEYLQKVKTYPSPPTSRTQKDPSTKNKA